MKHLQIAARPDPERSPALFTALADSPAVAEARAIDWNMAHADATTLLYAIDGDAEAFRDAALETSGVDTVDLSAVDAATSHALAQVRPKAIPLFRTVAEGLARSGIVVRKPVVYRDGAARAHIVGDPEPIQAALDAAPPHVSVDVDEIGTFPCARADPGSALSERQLEAVTVALDLGYYDRPRTATHDDVAAELDCAPSTASEHLRKAESKLIRAGVDVPGGR